MARREGNLEMEIRNLPAGMSPQLFDKAFTDIFSWFPFATSSTRPEQRADFTPAGSFCKHVFWLVRPLSNLSAILRRIT